MVPVVGVGVQEVVQTINHMRIALLLLVPILRLDLAFPHVQACLGVCGATNGHAYSQLQLSVDAHIPQFIRLFCNSYPKQT